MGSYVKFMIMIENILRLAKMTTDVKETTLDEVVRSMAR